jgi:hypothetical protein
MSCLTEMSFPLLSKIITTLPYPFQGAVHKWRHAFFQIFQLPPPLLSRTVTKNVSPPIKMPSQIAKPPEILSYN